MPEFAATLLIEDGLAFALIPAFSMALARRAQGAPGDPVRALVAATLPRLSLAFVAVGRAGRRRRAASWSRLLAPGLPDPALAVDCTRLTAISVLSFGLAGYCSAALRAHRRFVAPGGDLRRLQHRHHRRDVRARRRAGACGRRRSGSRWAGC